jgi:hypothetical protein
MVRGFKEEHMALATELLDFKPLDLLDFSLYHEKV